MSQQRHGLSILIFEGKQRGVDFLSLNWDEKRSFVKELTWWYSPCQSLKPSSVAMKLCKRILQSNHRMTVAEWNGLVERVARRVSRHPGSIAVAKSLQLEMTAHRIKESRVVNVSKNWCGDDVVTVRGRLFLRCHIDERWQRLRKLALDRIQKIEDAAIERRMKDGRLIARMVRERRQINSLIKQIKEIQNVKHNLGNSQNIVARA